MDQNGSKYALHRGVWSALHGGYGARSTGGGYEARSIGGVWSAYESSAGHIYDTCFFRVFGRMRRFLGLQRVPHPILGSWAPWRRFHPKWPFGLWGIVRAPHGGGVWSALHRGGGVWSALHRGAWSAHKSATGHLYDTLFFLVFGRMRRFLGLQRVPTRFWGPGLPIGDFTQNGLLASGVSSALHMGGGGMERAPQGGGVWSALHRGCVERV